MSKTKQIAEIKPDDDSGIAYESGGELRLNISKNGQPFGQLWTFPETMTENHPISVKLLHLDEAEHFYGHNAGYRAGKWVEAQANE